MPYRQSIRMLGIFPLQGPKRRADTVTGSETCLATRSVALDPIYRDAREVTCPSLHRVLYVEAADATSGPVLQCGRWVREFAQVFALKAFDSRVWTWHRLNA